MIKKKIITGIVLGFTAIAVASGGYAVKQYNSARHPKIEAADNGWNFTYDLCVPMPPPMACRMHTFILYIPKGSRTINMPKPDRGYDLETLDQARIEAEMKADIIENVKR